MNDLFHKWIGSFGVAHTIDADGIYIWENWDNVSVPTQSAIVAKKKELTVPWDAQLYARNRKLEYNALNQLELMTDDAANSTTTHADAIAVIKTKWPKNNTGPVE